MAYSGLWWVKETTEFDDTAWLVPPRCGSTSMDIFMGGEGGENICATLIKDLPHRILVMRHPMQRLYSTYRMFRSLDLIESGWPAFVDRVLAGSGDVHMIPQTTLSEGVENEYIDINLVHTRLPGFPHENQVGHAPFKGHRREELEEYYAADYAAWEKT